VQIDKLENQVSAYVMTDEIMNELRKNGVAQNSAPHHDIKSITRKRRRSYPVFEIRYYASLFKNS
jgi:hypothetical protein